MVEKVEDPQFHEVAERNYNNHFGIKNHSLFPAIIPEKGSDWQVREEKVESVIN